MTCIRVRAFKSARAGLLFLFFADVAWALNYVVVNNRFLFTNDIKYFGEIALGLFLTFIVGLFLPFVNADFSGGWYFSLNLFVLGTIVAAGLSVMFLDWFRQSMSVRQSRLWFAAISCVFLFMCGLQAQRLFNEPIPTNFKLAIFAFILQVVFVVVGLVIRYRKNLFEKTADS